MTITPTAITSLRERGPRQPERRMCWHCKGDFVTRKRDVVYCSQPCGRLARGYLANGSGCPKAKRAA